MPVHSSQSHHVTLFIVIIIPYTDAVRDAKVSSEVSACILASRGSNINQGRLQ